MLRVKIELVPFGFEADARTIAEMVIANTGNKNVAMGDYKAVIEANEWSGEPRLHCTLEGWDRSKSVWGLLEALLEARKSTEIPDEELFNLLTDRLGLGEKK